jgi:hypothetical protein
MTFDPRWKNPQGRDPEQLWRWAQDLVTELRKGGSRPPVLINSGSLSGNDRVIATSIPATYRALHLRIDDYSVDTAARALLVQPSSDNGANYDTTAGNFTLLFLTSAASAGAAASASLFADFSNAADAVSDMSLMISGYQGGPYAQGSAIARITAGTGAGASIVSHSTHWSADAINALRVIMSGSGNMDGGTFALYGIP